jgi:hypothetical protein
MAQNLPVGQRLSADRARAARLAFLGANSLDAPHDSEASYADFLPAQDDPTNGTEQIRPKVGTGAALEALSVLQRYSSARSVLRSLPADAQDVDAIEETLTVPREAFARKAILDACAILRSYVSTATDGELCADLRNDDDDRRDERAVKVGAVREVLNAMGAIQRGALVYTFGIGGAPEFGRGDTGDLDGLAEAMGVERVKANNNRVKAFKTFAKRWVERVATSVEHAAELTAAAAANLARGGRK